MYCEKRIFLRERMKKIRRIFCDIGGVLLTNGWDRSMRSQACQIFTISNEVAEKRHSIFFNIYELGKISIDEYIQNVFFFDSSKISLEEFKKFMFSCSKPFPEMIDLIQEVTTNNHLHLFALNNEGKELNDYRIAKFGLNDFFHGFVSSSYVGLRKPDPAIYRVALELSFSKPSEVLYIDDRIELIEVAEKMGIRSLHHTSYEKTKKYLENL